MKTDTVRIGTRGSALALVQARQIAGRLEARHPGLKAPLAVIRTRGDIFQDVALAKIGGKGVFVKEIEEALLRGEIDLAVHSLKDVPVDLAPGLALGAVPAREDPRDALVGREGCSLEALPPGARIGTGSLRRRCQLRRALPEVEVVPLRGNLETRLRKIATERLDAVVVAAAGILRMGWERRICQYLSPEVMLPAPGQGVLALEVRAGDRATRERIAFLHHEPTARAVEAERAFLRRLGGGCQLPVAAHAWFDGETLVFRGLIASLCGADLLRDEVRGAAAEAEILGAAVAERLLARGGQALLDAAYRGEA